MGNWQICVIIRLDSLKTTINPYIQNFNSVVKYILFRIHLKMDKHCWSHSTTRNGLNVIPGGAGLLNNNHPPGKPRPLLIDNE